MSVISFDFVALVCLPETVGVSCVQKALMSFIDNKGDKQQVDAYY